MSLVKVLKKLAVAMHRTPEEVKKTSSAEADLFKISVLASCLFLIVLVYGLPVFSVFRAWGTNKLEVVISPKDWKLFYHASPEECGDGAVASKGCVGNPDNPLLWNSELTRADPKHFEHLKQIQGSEFWVGSIIDSDKLVKAASKNANVFVLGRVGGSFRIWINGKNFLSGSRKDAVPVEVTIPKEMLLGDRPLHIAVQISHDSRHPYPDVFNGFSIGEGLATQSQSALFLNYDHFINAMRTFGQMLLNISFAMLFFVLWRAAPVKQEYFYIAFYSLINGVAQFKNLEIVYSLFMPETTYSADIFLRFIEGGFALLLGLAYSRLKRRYLRMVMAAVFLPALLSVVLPLESTTKFELNALVAKVYIPLCCLAGAFFCFLQAWYLYFEKAKVLFLPLRVRRLVLFSLGLAFIGVLNYVNSALLVSKSQLVLWSRIGHFTLLSFLGHIVFREYKEQGRLIEKTPVSEYHRRPELPAQVWGVLLIADLKASEFFYRHRAEKNPYADEHANIVTLWRSHFSTTILKHGGTVVGQKGDEIIAFFDREKNESPEERAFHCVQEMVQGSKCLEQEQKDKGSYPENAPSLHFRAAMSRGAIRPIWEELGSGERIPYWEEASNTTPFVDLSRILEFERVVPESKDHSLLVLEQHFANQLLALKPQISTQVLHAGLEKQDKHGRVHKVHILDLDKSTYPIDIKEKKSA